MPFELSAPLYTAAIAIRENLFQNMLTVPLHARIAQLGKILQGIVHIPFSNNKHLLAYSYLYASALTRQSAANPDENRNL
jgi:hypothetical protein